MSNLVSDCHKAEMVVRGDSFGEGTNHYECTVCGKPCNFVEDTHNTDIRNKIRFYLRKELDKWDRVELDLKNGDTAEYMPIDLILEVLPPVVATLQSDLIGRIEAEIMKQTKHLIFDDGIRREAVPTEDIRSTLEAEKGKL